MKFSIKDISRKSMRIWSHLLEKSLMKNFIFLCSKIDQRMRKHSQHSQVDLEFNLMQKYFYAITPIFAK